MSAIKQPYQVVLAGEHFVGKTTIFTSLKSCFEDVQVNKFKFVKSPNGYRFESCLHQYMDSSRKVKLQLWDTASMEREGGVGTMTRGYFRQAIAVILVYDTRNLESLWKLKNWVKMANDACNFKQHLIYALWGNVKEEMYSSVDNPVDMCHLEDLQKSLPKEIEPHLVATMDGQNQDTVLEHYEQLVRTVDSRTREIERQLKEASMKGYSDVEGDGQKPIRVGDDEPEEDKGCLKRMTLC